MESGRNPGPSDGITRFPIWARFITGVILSATSGLFILLSFPPYGLWPLIWVALIPARIAQYRLFPNKWSNLGEGITLLVWLGPFLGRLFGTDNGPFFTYLGIFIAILVFFISGDRKFNEFTGYRWFVLNGMAGWVGFEMIRATFIPLVATSGFIGYTLASQSWLIQPVSIFSIYGLNLLIIMVNYSFAGAIIHWVDRLWRVKGSVPMKGQIVRRWLSISGITLAAWLALSLILLLAEQDGQKIKVAAIQPNYSKPAFQDNSSTDRSRLGDLKKWSQQASEQGALVVFTPEMMLNFDPQKNYTSELQELARTTGLYLFLNYTVSEEGSSWRNETVLLGPDGEFYSPVYAKYHAPPGESLSPTAGVFPVFETPIGILSAMICHDANYTDVARKLSGSDAQLISSGLNEFGGFGEQYWTGATFRAVENQTAIVVAARQTGSALIDHRGNQIALDINAGKETILLGEITLGDGKTVYTTIGDIPGWISLAGMIFFIVFQSIRLKKK